MEYGDFDILQNNRRLIANDCAKCLTQRIKM